jgi:hypothetical protein
MDPDRSANLPDDDNKASALNSVHSVRLWENEHNPSSPIAPSSHFPWKAPSSANLTA